MDQMVHGTHVASVAAGARAEFAFSRWVGNGAAEHAIIVNVPVTNGKLSDAGTLARGELILFPRPKLSLLSFSKRPTYMGI